MRRIQSTTRRSMRCSVVGSIGISNPYVKMVAVAGVVHDVGIFRIVYKTQASRVSQDHVHPRLAIRTVAVFHDDGREELQRRRGVVGRVLVRVADIERALRSVLPDISNVDIQSIPVPRVRIAASGKETAGPQAHVSCLHAWSRSWG